jgi:hypothetical protein
MKELSHHPDYYRFVQLLIAHVELEHSRQWRIDVRRRSKIPLGMCRSPDSSRQVPGRTAIVQSISPDVYKRLRVRRPEIRP